MKVSPLCADPLSAMLSAHVRLFSAPPGASPHYSQLRKVPDGKLACRELESLKQKREKELVQMRSTQQRHQEDITKLEEGVKRLEVELISTRSQLKLAQDFMSADQKAELEAQQKEREMLKIARLQRDELVNIVEKLKVIHRHSEKAHIVSKTALCSHL